MSVIDKSKRDKHARLVARLAKMEEAKLIQEANMAQANGEGILLKSWKTHSKDSPMPRLIVTLYSLR